jgi:hypothetical protein
MKEEIAVTSLMELKRTALSYRQDLDDVVDLYLGFQNYIEHLARVLKGDLSWQEFGRTQVSYDLRLTDREPLFYEWDEGEQVLNMPVFSLVREPQHYGGELEFFKVDLLRAVEKFKYLIDRRERELRKVHEKIALELSESEAETITQLEPPRKPVSLIDQAKRADETMESVWKWGERLVRFLPWANTILM